MSPKTKFRSRNNVIQRQKHGRRVTPETWKKNIRTYLGLSGKEYVTTSGKKRNMRRRYILFCWITEGKSMTERFTKYHH